MYPRFLVALALASLFAATFFAGSVSSRLAHAQAAETPACAQLRWTPGDGQPGDTAARWMDEQLAAGRTRFVTTYVEMGTLVPVSCAY